MSRVEVVNAATPSNAVANEVFDLINEERVSRGLSAIKYSQELDDAASIRVYEAVAKWSDIRPDGSDFYAVNENIHAECLSKGSDSSIKVVNNWMDSRLRANILNPEYEACGVGVIINHDGRLVVALEIGY